MAEWTGVVTNAGKSLLGAWAGGGVLNFDSAAEGSGTVSVETLIEQTGLASQKKTINIIGSESVSNGQKIKLRITSQGIVTAHTCNQIGIWASVDGGASSMIAIVQSATGQPIPSYAEIADFVWDFYLIVEMSNSGTFTLSINSTTFATVEDLNAHNEASDAHSVVIGSAVEEGITTHNADQDAHPAIPRRVISGLAELGLTSSAKLADICAAIPSGAIAMIDYASFDKSDLTGLPSVTAGTFYIHKFDDTHCPIYMGFSGASRIAASTDYVSCYRSTSTPKVAPFARIPTDSIGHVVGARFSRTTQQSIASAAWVSLIFTDRPYNPDGSHNDSYPTRMYCRYAGLYSICAMLALVSLISNSDVDIRILKNGTERLTGAGLVNSHATTSYINKPMSCAIDNVSLSVGDYLELQVYVPSIYTAAAITASGATPFSGIDPYLSMRCNLL